MRAGQNEITIRAIYHFRRNTMHLIRRKAHRDEAIKGNVCRPGSLRFADDPIATGSRRTACIGHNFKKC